MIVRLVIMLFYPKMVVREIPATIVVSVSVRLVAVRLGVFSIIAAVRPYGSTLELQR